MGFPAGIMIFLSAIILAVSFNHLFLAFRLKGSLLHYTVFATGVLSFAWCIMIYLGYNFVTEVHTLERIYRVHLILMQLSLLSLLLAYAWLVGFSRKGWLVTMISFFLALVLTSVILPGKMLYPAHSIATIVILFNSPVTTLGDGLTYWRLMADLSLMGGIFFSLTMLMHQLTRHSATARTSLALMVVIFFVVAIMDHLIDIGVIAFIYMVPFGYFISFGMLSAASLDNMMKEISRNHDLKIEERKWRMMAREVRLLIVELNTLGQARYVNPYLLDVTGYHENEIIGKDWFEILLPVSHAYEVQSAFLEILANDFYPVYQNPIKTKYDEERMIAWYNVRLRDRNGKITGSISIGVDITEFHDNIVNLENTLSEARKLIDKMKEDAG